MCEILVKIFEYWGVCVKKTDNVYYTLQNKSYPPMAWGGETTTYIFHIGVESLECSNISLTIQNEEEVFSIKELKREGRYIHIYTDR